MGGKRKDKGKPPGKPQPEKQGTPRTAMGFLFKGDKLVSDEPVMYVVNDEDDDIPVDISIDRSVVELFLKFNHKGLELQELRERMGVLQREMADIKKTIEQRMADSIKAQTPDYDVGFIHNPDAERAGIRTMADGRIAPTEYHRLAHELLESLPEPFKRAHVKEHAEPLGVPEYGIDKIIKLMLEHKLVTRKGTKRATHYVRASGKRKPPAR